MDKLFRTILNFSIEKRKILETEIAFDLNVSERTVINWCKGKTIPSTKTEILVLIALFKHL